MNQWNVDVLILALGGNDGLRGIDLNTVESNLVGIIGRARELRPGIDIVLAGIQPPPNMGPDYTEGFKRLYPDLARSEGAMLIPFLLQDVGGVEALNQADGIHPTAEGQKLLARNVWSVLEPVLAKRVEAGDS
jgi:acyl-CoA thioesterase-1